MNRVRIYALSGLGILWGTMMMTGCHHHRKNAHQQIDGRLDSVNPVRVNIQAQLIKAGQPQEVKNEQGSFDETLKTVKELRSGEIRANLCSHSSSKPCEQLDEFLSADVPVTLPEGTYLSVGPLFELGLSKNDMNFVLDSRPESYVIVGLRSQGGQLEVSFQDVSTESNQETQQYNAYIQSLSTGKPDLQNPSHQDARRLFQAEKPLWLKAEPCAQALCATHLAPHHSPITIMIRQKNHQLYFLLNTWVPGHPPAPALFFSFMPLPLSL